MRTFLAPRIFRFFFFDFVYTLCTRASMDLPKLAHIIQFAHMKLFNLEREKRCHSQFCSFLNVRSAFKGMLV